MKKLRFCSVKENEELVGLVVVAADTQINDSNRLRMSSCRKNKLR